MRTTLRIATRASDLALWQSRHVATLLRRRWAGLRTVLVPLTSHGDVDQQTPLYGMGGVGVFCSEVQRAVLDGVADIGVHSLKDLPTAGTAGLMVAAHIQRADVRDALVGAPSLAALAPGATVASSSLRRRAQLAALRPDLTFVDIRGNVHTRLRKIREGLADATLLALAGLQRLQLARAVGAIALDPWTVSTPAPGQGAIAVECRSDDSRCLHLLGAIDDHHTAVATGIERAVLAGLRGGCSLPLGCYAQRHGSRWQVSAKLGQGAGELRQVTLSGPAHGLAARVLSQLQQG